MVTEEERRELLLTNSKEWLVDELLKTEMKDQTKKELPPRMSDWTIQMIAEGFLSHTEQMHYKDKVLFLVRILKEMRDIR
jgi:hypothetical protein